LPRCKVDVELAAALGLCVRTRKVNLNVLAVARPNHAFGTLKKRTEVFEERRVADIDVQGRRCAPSCRSGVANLTLVAKDHVSSARR
jgi:hypothetical protein